VGREGIEEALEWWRRDLRQLLQPAPPSQPLFRPIPKVPRGTCGRRAAVTSNLVRGPTPCGGLDDRHVQRIPTREIEMSRDHHELTGDVVERGAGVPEVFQMAEELASFFWERTLMLARQGDRSRLRKNRVGPAQSIDRTNQVNEIGMTAGD